MKIGHAPFCWTIAVLLPAGPCLADEIVSDPAVGVEVTASPGTNIYRSKALRSQEGLQTEADSRPSGWFGAGAETLPAGTKLVIIPGYKSIVGCVPSEGSFDPKGPCFYDQDHDGSFDRTTLELGMISTKLKSPVPYSKAVLSILVNSLFDRVFLYQGATSDSIRFSYREFDGVLARPAFTEEISIPREPTPYMVRIKDLQIEVLKVGGMGLTYRIVGGN